jgi:hypothetical protein
MTKEQAMLSYIDEIRKVDKEKNKLAFFMDILKIFFLDN